MQSSSAKDKIKEFWDSRALSFDKSFGHGIYSDEEIKTWEDMFKHVVGKEHLKFLDLGCGTGEISKVLADMGHSVVGVDFAPTMVELANKKLGSYENVKIIKGDVGELNLEEGSFDAIFARHLLWTIVKPKDTLLKWYSLLKNGGSIIIADGNWRKRTVKKSICNNISNLIKKLTNESEPEDKFKDKFTGSYDEIYKEFDYPNGLNESDTKSILEDVGFIDVKSYNINAILKAQKRAAPLYWKFLDRKSGRYTLYAKKP